ncbi:MFS transporter [Staphylococcus equorum]|nr:MFS transporter [Staphylococcus equorum]OEK70061.1 MFS transporter [Staphylococcus equorum]
MVSNQINVNKFPKKIIITILILGTFLTAFNQTVMSVATPEVMKDLNVSAATAQWLTTAYMLVNGVLVPITAFLMKRFTTKQLFTSAMFLFLLGSLIAAMSTDFTFLLVGRMVQASGAGIMIPLLYSVVMILYHPSERGTVMGMVSLAVLSAPAIGPTISGYVIDALSWHSLFGILVPVSLIVIVLGYFFLENVTETQKDKIDLTSMLLSTIAFSLILYGFSSAGEMGWTSNIVMISFVVGIISLILFVVRQLKATNPFLDLKVFKYGTFTLTNIINIGVTIIMYADMILLPIYLQNVLGYSAMESGVFMLPGAVLMAAMSPIAGKLYDLFGAKWITIVGVIITIVSTIPFMDLSQDTNYYYLLAASTGRRIGMALLLTPIQTAGLNVIPKELSAHASAVWNTIRQIAGAIGTSLLVTIMTMGSNNYITDHASTSKPQEQLMLLANIQGINIAYFAIIVVAVVSLVLSFWIKESKAIKED